MAAITWRNVNGPSLAEASRPLEVAQRSFGSVFDTLGGLVNKVEAVDTRNWDTTKENNTQAFLNTLAQAKTPEEMAAMQKSGQLAQMLSGFGGQVNQAAVRSAPEARLDALYKQTKTANEYQDYSLDREQAPIRDKALSLAVQGNKAGALALLEANPTLRNAAEIHKAVVNGERDMTRFGFEVNQDRRAGQALQSTLASQRMSREATGLQIQQTRQEIADADKMRALEARIAAGGAEYLKTAKKGDSDTEAADKLMKQLRKEGYTPSQLARVEPLLGSAFSTMPVSKIGNDAAAVRVKDAQAQWYKDNGIAAPGSTEALRNIPELAGFINTITKDTDEQASLNRALAKLSKTEYDLGGGRKIGYPQEILRAALLESHQPATYNIFNWKDRGEVAEQLAKKMMKDSRIIDDIAAREQLDAEAIRRKFTEQMKEPGSKMKEPGSKKK